MYILMIISQEIREKTRERMKLILRKQIITSETKTIFVRGFFFKCKYLYVLLCFKLRKFKPYICMPIGKC